MTRSKWRKPVHLIGALVALTSALASHAAADPEKVAAGKYLVEIGGCQSCHTKEGGQPFAGGLYMDTPFGPISTPNITPDRQTGIGAWSDEDFYKVMHDGLGKHGEYIYPVMPFPFYTNLSRDDVMKIRAYLATLPAVHNVRPPNKLRFPFSLREGLLAWRIAFFKAATFTPDPTQSAEVNRGAYLVNGLGHCGECHNAHQVAGASKYAKAFQGGVVNDWYAPNITGDVRYGVGDWSTEQMAVYLKTGISPSKGIAAGPMAETVKNLSNATDADLKAMAAYLKTVKAIDEPHAKMALYQGSDARGAGVYLNNCASCHGIDGKGIKGVIPGLQGNGSVTAKGPQNVIQVVLGGLEARGSYAPMPAVGAAMSDEDIAMVTDYVRQMGQNAAPTTAEAGEVGKLRKETDTLMNGAPNGQCPAIEDAALAQAIDHAGIAKSFAGMQDTQMLEIARQSVQKLKQAHAATPQAALINGVVSTYCSVLTHDATVDATERAVRLGQFAELVYTEADGRGYHPQ